jgi:hypothetical protein
MKRVFLSFVSFLLLGSIAWAAWAGTGAQFRGYQARGSENYEEDLGIGSPLECMDHGAKWLAKQSSPDAMFVCGSGCETRTDGSSFCKRVIEIDKTGGRNAVERDNVTFPKKY